MSKELVDVNGVKREYAQRPQATIQNGELYLHGVIGDPWDGLDSAKIINEIEGFDGDFTIRINSPGGYVTEGLAIYDTAKAYNKGEISVVIEGMAASMASIIALAGDSVQMRPNAIYMIHNPWVVVGGDSRDLRKMADYLDKLGGLSVNIYSQFSGQDLKQIQAWMDEETYFTAEEAQESGFINSILQEDGPSAKATQKIPKEVQANIIKKLQADLQSAVSVKQWSAASVLPTSMVNALIEFAGSTSDTPAGVAVNNPQTQEDDTMSDEEKKKAAAQQAEAVKLAAQQAIKLDKSVRKMCSNMNLGNAFSDELSSEVTSMFTEGDKANDFDACKAYANEKVLAKLSENQPQINGANGAATVTVDGGKKFVAGAGLALLARSGHEDGERNEFSGLSLREIARQSLEMAGIKTQGMNMRKIAGLALNSRTFMTMSGHSTSDFTLILEDVANKSMLKGFEEAPENFERWTRKGELGDFKAAKRVDVGTFPILDEIKEGAEYKYATLNETGESIMLATYGKKFSITRQTIINDDLDAFSRIPGKMGRAARRTVGNMAYQVLTANANMSDGKDLFHADHGNLAGAAGAPSTATLDAARTAMGTQDYLGETVDVIPRFALVPKAKQGVMNTVIKSETEIKSGQNNSKVPNSVVGMIDPEDIIADGRLDASSASAWYLAADPNMHDTVEVAYLDGEDKPYLEESENFDTDGMTMKVRIDAAAKALAWQGLYKNAG